MVTSKKWTSTCANASSALNGHIFLRTTSKETRYRAAMTRPSKSTISLLLISTFLLLLHSISAQVCLLCQTFNLPDPSRNVAFQAAKNYSQTPSQSTCGVIESLGSLNLNDCSGYQKLYGQQCCHNVTQNQTGTTQPTQDCRLCINQNDSPQNLQATFSVGSATLSCQTAFDLGALQLPESNCTLWQNRGATVCKCTTNATIPVNDCLLCRSKALPSPQMEGSPGKLCSELQVDARRDLASRCPVWQETYGVYCGCDFNASSPNTCRLCGGTTELPNPLQAVDLISNSGPSTSSCGQLEFQSNLPQYSCSQFQQLYAGNCCNSVIIRAAAANERFGWLVATFSGVFVVLLWNF